MKKDILEEAICVAQRFIDYDGYGQNFKRARRALKGRVPGYPIEKYQTTLEKAIKHYTEAIDFVKANQDQFWRNYNKYKNDEDIPGCYKGLDKKFLKSQKGFKLTTVRSTLAWIFYLYCMR